MYKIAPFLIISLISHANPIQGDYNNYSIDLDIPQTRAQVHTLKTDAIDSTTVDRKRVSVLEDKIEFSHKQGIALDTLTIKYLIG